jgi:lipooligosaccharide transport system ATP-binding protein
VYGDEVGAWANANVRSLVERLEVSGETAFCYTHSPDAALQALAARPQLRVLRRAANLEDVFIKLTGRDIRD